MLHGKQTEYDAGLVPEQGFVGQGSHLVDV